MAEDEHTGRVDAGLLLEQGNRGDGIVGGFRGQADAITEVLRSGLGALVIAQYRNALCGQAVGDIGKRLVRADRFIAVLRAGAVDQHDGREGAIALGQAQGGAQWAGAVDDLQGQFTEGSIGGHGRGRTRDRCQMETGDAPLRVDDRGRQQGALVELQPADDALMAIDQAQLTFRIAGQRPQLLVQCLPELGQSGCRHGLGHLWAEACFGGAELPGLQLLDQLLRTLLRAGGQGELAQAQKAGGQHQAGADFHAQASFLKISKVGCM